MRENERQTVMLDVTGRRNPVSSRGVCTHTYTPINAGVDVFLADDTLWVEVRDSSRSRGGSEVVETLPIEGVALRTRTWYFLDVQVRLGWLV